MSFADILAVGAGNERQEHVRTRQNTHAKQGDKCWDSERRPDKQS